MPLHRVPCSVHQSRIALVRGHRTPYSQNWQAPRWSRSAKWAVTAAAGSSGGRGGGQARSTSTGSNTRSACHYEILGLPRTATKDEVKRAFRRLARVWHPDVCNAPGASERFQIIARAFEVLSDDELRQEYDQARWGSAAPGGAAWRAGRARRAPQAGPGMEPPPPDLHAELRLDFREAALGAERMVEVHVMDACRVCDGTGAAAGTAATPCPMCKGRREILKRQRLGAIDSRNHEAGHMQFTVCCPICAGRGFSVTHPCSRCAGAGLARQPRRVAVRVPAGAEHGGRLRLAGEGDVERVGGPRGGLVLELTVDPGDSGMWRRGLDLHSQLAVPLWDALLGGTATVTTLRGDASITIPPGTQHGAVLSLAHAGVEQAAAAAGGSSSGEGGGAWSASAAGGGGQGRSGGPRRGSHHFEVVVQVPRQVSSAEEALLRRLAELQQERRQRKQRSASGKG